MHRNKIFIRHLGIKPYKSVFLAMHDFTNNRDQNTFDEIWLVEHFPVFTQGQKGKAEHLLNTSNIQIIQSDRGGQITYHGPGQQIMYILLNLKRRKLSIRELIVLIEQSVINTLVEYGIYAYQNVDKPGVYVEGQKICSLGLRIKNGCCLHGLALNINMDLSPFLCINPCGFPGMKMTQMCNWNSNLTTSIVRPRLIKCFLELLNNPIYEYISN